MITKLVHGIRSTEDGKKTMGPLLKVLELWDVEATIVGYGYVLVPITNSQAVEAILEAIDGYDGPITIAAYSNAAWAAVQVAEMGNRIDRLVLISPALHKAREFPGHIGQIDVFHSPGDDAVQAGKWWRWLTGWLPWRWSNPHGWGEMGRTGYVGKDERVRNHKLPPEVGHYWYEDSRTVQRIANVVAGDR